MQKADLSTLVHTEKQGALGSSVLSALTVVITAAYILWTMQRVYLGTNPAYKDYKDITIRELTCIIPLVILAVVMFYEVTSHLLLETYTHPLAFALETIVFGIVGPAFVWATLNWVAREIRQQGEGLAGNRRSDSRIRGLQLRACRGRDFDRLGECTDL